MLVTLALVNLILVYISYCSYEFFPASNYELKLKAAKIMKEALSNIPSDVATQIQNDNRDIPQPHSDKLAFRLLTRLVMQIFPSAFLGIFQIQ